jgi:hypothetical protein
VLLALKERADFIFRNIIYSADLGRRATYSRRTYRLIAGVRLVPFLSAEELERRAADLSVASMNPYLLNRQRDRSVETPTSLYTGISGTTLRLIFYVVQGFFMYYIACPSNIFKGRRGYI